MNDIPVLSPDKKFFFIPPGYTYDEPANFQLYEIRKNNFIKILDLPKIKWIMATIYWIDTNNIKISISPQKKSKVNNTYIKLIKNRWELSQNN